MRRVWWKEMTILYVDIGVRFLRDGGTFSPFGGCPIANNVASDRFVHQLHGRGIASVQGTLLLSWRIMAMR